MSNLTLSMALAHNAKKPAVPSGQQDSPSTPMTPITAVTPVLPTNGRMHAEESDKDDIPEFGHTIPAIFVPLKQDLLTPIEPAKDRVERLKRMQASLKANETAVRDNLAWMVCVFFGFVSLLFFSPSPSWQDDMRDFTHLMAFQFEREARRRVAHAKKTRDLSQPHRPEIINWDEGDKLLASLTTPANPGQSYHVSSETLAEWHQMKMQPVAPGQMTPHEQTVREVLFVANNGSREMRDYSTHIDTIRDKMKKSLERADGV